MLVIRLQRRGKKNQPFFWVVVAEKTAPIKGRFIERLGFWNPIKKDKKINSERVKYWISKGVKMSDTVYNLFLEEGVIGGEKRKIKIKKKKETDRPSTDKAKEEKGSGEKEKELESEISSGQASEGQTLEEEKSKEEEKSEKKKE